MRFVLKYGGSSVADFTKMQAIAKHLTNLRKENHEIVVVVSAMGKTTDQLINMAQEISPNPTLRELDALLVTGEMQSIAFLSMALNAMNCPAISMNASQAHIKSTGTPTKNQITTINVQNIEKHLKENKIVIVAGFQGINEDGDFTTLGRGGSDTSAVALAAALGCECHIYTDVSGVYTLDPQVYPEAKKITHISYEEMMEMAHLGAKVMAARAVEIGLRFNVPIHVAESLSSEGGTYIMNKETILEKKAITGISLSKDISITTFADIPYSTQTISHIFQLLSKHSVNINLIVQNVQDNTARLSFSSSDSEKARLQEVITEVHYYYPSISVENQHSLSMLSIVGIGMINGTGVASRFFETLSKRNIPFYQVSTSEISISCCIDSKDIDAAAILVAKEFDL